MYLNITNEIVQLSFYFISAINGNKFSPKIDFYLASQFNNQTQIVLPSTILAPSL